MLTHLLIRHSILNFSCRICHVLAGIASQCRPTIRNAFYRKALRFACFYPEIELLNLQAIYGIDEEERVVTHPSDKHSLDYKSAGVDIDAGDRLVQLIKGFAKATARPEVIGGLGGFGGLFEIPVHRYQQPVLVSGTDGVGTKLKLAQQLQYHQGIGIDLVAMCVNDVIVCGAEPLFFLDYYATGKLNPEAAAKVIEGISIGCRQAGCSLIGGETAEMPGMYDGEDYDLAGFCVGIVDKPKIITGAKVKVGDVLLGLASSGAHANGYSLIRKVLERDPKAIHETLAGERMADRLMAPTRIYVRSMLELLKTHDIHAMAHITGGGITENLPRVLPENTAAVINPKAWTRPIIFDWLQETGNIQQPEMWRTFNCGIGMVVVIDKNDASAIKSKLEAMGETVFEIGHIINAKENSDTHVIYES